MTSVAEIPTSPQPQRFRMAVRGITYQWTLTWNVPGARWYLALADGNGNPLHNGFPLETTRDLLEQFKYLGLGFGLFAATDHDPALPPAFANLGTTGHLYVATP